MLIKLALQLAPNMEGVFLLLILGFYILLRMVFSFKVDHLKRDTKRFSMGLELLHEQEYDQGLTFFNRAVQQYPQSALAYASRSRCQLGLGEPIMAMADGVRASAIDPYLRSVYLTKGKALFEMKEWTMAIVEFEKATWYDRECAEAHTWLGLTYIEDGQSGKAVKCFQKAVRMGDENAAYYLRKRHDVEIWKTI